MNMISKPQILTVLKCNFGDISFFTFLFIFIVTKLLPVIPRFPVPGLDPSWNYGLAVATSDHLIFGKDIIYTFGPLSSVYTGFWSLHGHILSLSLAFFVTILLSYFVYSLFAKASYLIKLLLLVFFFVNINSGPDFFYAVLPVLSALDLVKSNSRSRKLFFKLFLLGFIAALLILVKLSFGVEALFCLLLVLAFCALQRNTKACLVLVASFLVCFVLLYVASGQKISNIFYYPLNVIYGISGHLEAMSYPGPVEPVIATAVFLILFLAYLTWKNLKTFTLQGLFEVCLFGLLSLLLFKHSFVRNDSGHSVDVYLLQLFLLLYIIDYVPKSIIKNVLITTCILSLLLLGSKNYWYVFSGNQIKGAYNTLISKVRNTDRLFHKTQNRLDYENAVNNIRKAYPLPTLEGTSDLYTCNQAILLASDNKWNPRPEFQSYMTYSTFLANANYEHLLYDETAPDNIFFNMEIIDGRIPSMGDGMSWPALLGLYTPTGWTQRGDYLILKRDEVAKAPLSIKDVKKLEGKVGEEIAVPFNSGIINFKLNFRKSLPGALISVVYKTAPIWINLKMQDGSEKRFRIIPSMCETGFIISPLAENTNEFSNLYASALFDGKASGNRVVSFSISPEQPWQYASGFELTFERLEYPDKNKAVTYSVTKTAFDAQNAEGDPSMMFAVDQLTQQYADGKLLLTMRGWAYRKNVDIAESSYALLIREKDHDTCFEIPLNTVNRQDVSDYFADGHNYTLCGYSRSGLFEVPELKKSTEYQLYLRAEINKRGYTFPINSTLVVN